MKSVYTLNQGTVPFVMSIPHLGTEIPDSMSRRMTPEALRVPDTDWDLDRLYDFAGEIGAYVIQAHYSRYVVDLNRPPDNRSLYPGADTTGLVPVSTFASEPIYLTGQEPDDKEIAARRDRYWRPYHEAITQLLSEIKDRFGIAVLFDCHSIKSRVPRFFDGTLPDINLGTADGAACAPELEDLLEAVLQDQQSHSVAVNGRFKGGHITRYFGQPENGIHAYQIEHSTSAYMTEEPWFAFSDDRARTFRTVLRAAMEQAVAWTLARARMTS